MKITTSEALGGFKAKLEREGEEFPLYAWGETSADAIENVLLVAMNSRVQL